MATQKEVKRSDVATPLLRKLWRNLTCLWRRPKPAIVRDLSWRDAVEWLHEQLNDRIAVAAELRNELNVQVTLVREMSDAIYSPPRRVTSMQLHSLGIDKAHRALRWSVKLNSYDVPSKLCAKVEGGEMQIDLSIDLDMIRATSDDVLPTLIKRRISDMGAQLGRKLIENKLKAINARELVAGSEREFGRES